METEANAISSQFILIKEYFEEGISFDEFWEFERTKFLELIYSNLNSHSMERKERLSFKSNFEKSILLLIKAKIEKLDLLMINNMFNSQMSKITLH